MVCFTLEGRNLLNPTFGANANEFHSLAHDKIECFVHIGNFVNTHATAFRPGESLAGNFLEQLHEREAIPKIFLDIFDLFARSPEMRIAPRRERLRKTSKSNFKKTEQREHKTWHGKGRCSTLCSRRKTASSHLTLLSFPCKIKQAFIFFFAIVITIHLFFPSRHLNQFVFQREPSVRSNGVARSHKWTHDLRLVTSSPMSVLRGSQGPSSLAVSVFQQVIIFLKTGKPLTNNPTLRRFECLRNDFADYSTQLVTSSM